MVSESSEEKVQISRWVNSTNSELKSPRKKKMDDAEMMVPLLTPTGLHRRHRAARRG